MITITYLNGNKFEWEDIKELREEALKYDIKIGYGVRIGSDVRIGTEMIIESDAKGIITNLKQLRGLYRYSIDIIETTENTYIRMGCFTRTVNEWKKDFWNNEKEFQKSSVEGIKRLKAFNECMRILKLDELKY